MFQVMTIKQSEEVATDNVLQCLGMRGGYSIYYVDLVFH